MSADKSKKLTFKEDLFVSAYLGKAHGNGTLAAKMAGYSGDDNTLGSRAKHLLQKDKIAARVKVHVASAAMSADEVLAELSKIGKEDWKEFLDIRTNKDGEIVSAKIILGDKVRALELLGKYHALFTDRMQHEGEVGALVAVLTAADARALLEAKKNAPPKD